jgi:hypothetical protein
VAVSALIAVLAIWGESIRARLFGPRLCILPHNDLRGTHTPAIDPATNMKFESRYYHLAVHNERPRSIAHRVDVRLVRVQRKGTNGQSHEVALPVPLSLDWAPAAEGLRYPFIAAAPRVLDFLAVYNQSGTVTTQVLTRGLWAFRAR